MDLYFTSPYLDIITTPNERDPQMTAWKGAAIMSCLESAQELRIYPVEWEKLGVLSCGEISGTIYGSLESREYGRRNPLR
jgi:actin-related protein